MRDFAPLNDADLVRARQDPRFRAQLMAQHLDRLLAELQKMRARAGADPGRDKLIREGVAMAVRLSEQLQALADTRR